MHGTVRGLFRVLGALAMLAVFLSAWAAYRLSQGPLSLSGLTPYIEQALSRPAAGFSVKVGDTILSWNRASHSLEIQALDVHMQARDGRTLGSFPEMSVTLSGAALLRGRLVPRAIKLIHPTLHLIREQDGSISLGIGGDADGEDQPGNGSDVALAGFDALMEPPGKETLAGQLQRIQVTGGVLTIEDRRRGLFWKAPNSDLTFRRDDRGIALSARLDLDLEGQPGHLDVDGVYLHGDRVLDLTLAGGGIRPASLARLTPRLDFLEAVQVPIGGSVSLRYALGKGITALRADVAAGEGTLDLAPSAGFSVAVKSVRMRAGYAGDKLSLDELRIDLGGPVLTATGAVEGLSGDMRIGLQAQVDRVALDSLPAIWPRTLASNPRNWIVANLTHGAITGIATTLQGHVAAGHSLADLIVDKINGAMTVEDATVRYMPQMPVVQHVSAAANFDSDRLDISLAGGSAANLSLPEGRVVLSGLSKPDQDADIRVRVEGAMTDLLRFIDNPPLGYTRKLGLDPAAVKGSGVVDLGMRFPLIDDLSLDRLKIKVEADTKDLFLPKVVQDLDLAGGNLHLSITNDGLDASGSVQIDNHPGRLRWRGNFARNAPFRNRYQVSALLSDDGRKLVGLSGLPFQPPYLSGAVPVEVTATERDGRRYDLSVAADLSPVSMAIPGLNFVKPAGMDARASAQVQLADDQLVQVPRFHVEGKSLDVTGSVSFEKGEVRKIVLSDAAFARTQMRGSVTFRPDGALSVAAEGESFDAREIVHGRPSDPLTDKEPTAPMPPPAHPHPTPRPQVTPLVIQARFGRIWLSDQGWMSDAAADLVRDHYDWRSAHISGEVGEHAPLKIDLVPSDPGHRTLTVASSDAGSVFRALDVFDNIMGGRLLAGGTFDDRDPARPLTGTVEVKEFQLAKAPVLAKLLTVAGLTGILDLLSGQGIHFNGLDMPFTYADGQLSVRDGRASGSALGFTAKGQVDLDNDRLGLEGTIVPAYALNSALGNLPIVGGLFSAEKGGGILAINYRMTGPMGDPDFTVNPLSALTPGFLRNLFNLFDTNETPKPPSGDQPHQ